MLVRRFETSDEPQVITLWNVCGLTRAWNNPHADIARKLTVQRDLFLVGCDGLQVIATAMAGFDGHRGWVNYLAVAPSHRLQGHAAALMARVEALLLEAECPKLNLQVRAGNADAVAFYRRIGYLPDEAVCYGKRLIVDAPAQ